MDLYGFELAPLQQRADILQSMTELEERIRRELGEDVALVAYSRDREAMRVASGKRPH